MCYFNNGTALFVTILWSMPPMTHPWILLFTDDRDGPRPACTRIPREVVYCFRP